MKLSRLFFLIFLPLSLSIYAQDLHENVSVEGIYRPDFVAVERFNTFPEHKTFDLVTTPLDFDLRPSVTPFNTEIAQIGIVGWRSSLPPVSRGYLDLSLGSWLNSSLSAGYRVLDKNNSHLDISLQHNSTSLWKPFGADSENTRFRYDESLAARFSHDFSGSILDLSLLYHFGYFNYYSYLPLSPLSPSSPASPSSPQNGVSIHPKAPTQSLNDLAFRAGWHSPASQKGVWRLNLNVRHFAFRSLYFLDIDRLSTFKGDRETSLSLSGGYSLNWDNGSVLGVDANADAFLYSKQSRAGILPSPDNYGRLQFTPYYSFRKNHFNISLGADIDLFFNAPGSSRDSHFALFHIAPDVKLDWQTGPMGLYLELLGGCSPVTMASQYEKDYYSLPALAACSPVYTPFDGRLGFEFGPFHGFSAGLRLSFRTSRHVPFYGWYPTMLNYGNYLPSDLGLHTSMIPEYSLNTSGHNVHGFQFRLNAKYAASIWKAEASVAYMPQNASTAWVDGIDCPRWLLSARVSVRPLPKLHIAVGYDYRGVRSLPLPLQLSYIGNGSNSASGSIPNEASLSRTTIINGSTTIINGENTDESAVRLPDLTLLNAEATWHFTPRLSLGIRADNLLNRRVQTLPNLPTPGLDIQGRLTLRF